MEGVVGDVEVDAAAEALRHLAIEGERIDRIQVELAVDDVGGSGVGVGLRQRRGKPGGGIAGRADIETAAALDGPVNDQVVAGVAEVGVLAIVDDMRTGGEAEI